jgi:hypothetical protein
MPLTLTSSENDLPKTRVHFPLMSVPERLVDVIGQAVGVPASHA